MHKPKITCSCLGNFGRFGNQLFQAAFCLGYAKKYNLDVEFPTDWIGRKIFNMDHIPAISSKLPQMGRDKVPWGYGNWDAYGYFQNQKAIDLYSKKDVHDWFLFKDRFYLDLVDINKTRLYDAAHRRVGDYVGLPNLFCIPTIKAYEKAFEQYGAQDVTWVTEESPRSHKSLPEEISFLADFFILMHARKLFRGPSTFSWWAAVLGDVEVYSPVVKGKFGETDCEFVKGNHPIMISFDSKDHTDLYLREA